MAGDALRTAGGQPALPSPPFTSDIDQAFASVAKLGGLTFETLLVGHGDPIQGGASAAVGELSGQAWPGTPAEVPAAPDGAARRRRPRGGATLDRRPEATPR